MLLECSVFFDWLKITYTSLQARNSIGHHNSAIGKDRYKRARTKEKTLFLEEIIQSEEALSVFRIAIKNPVARKLQFFCQCEKDCVAPKTVCIKLCKYLCYILRVNFSQVNFVFVLFTSWLLAQYQFIVSILTLACAREHFETFYTWSTTAVKRVAHKKT